MIARCFKATATVDGAKRYAAFFEHQLVPQLKGIEGHCGALVMAHPANEEGVVEITVLTFWASMEAVRRFAGDEPARAVLEPEARAILSSFDEIVTHAEVIAGGEVHTRKSG